MPRKKGQTDDIHIKIQRGLRDASIDHMAIEDPRCWPWQGALTTSGYARIGKRVAHHALYELHIRTKPGWEDYKLPTAEFEDTLCHKIYPTNVTGKKIRKHNLLYGRLKLPCTNQACINPYHRDWEGVRAPKPADWNPKTDNPKELQQDVPSLPTAAPTPSADPLLELVASCFEPDELNLPFDELFAILEETWAEHPVDDLRNALIEVLKGRQ